MREFISGISQSYAYRQKCQANVIKGNYHIHDDKDVWKISIYATIMLSDLKVYLNYKI